MNYTENVPIALRIADVTFGTTGVALNIAALASMYFGLRELRPFHRFLICLSISDIAAPIMFVTATFLNHLPECSGPRLFLKCGNYISYLLLGGNIFLLALDLYLAICRPLHYQNIMTPRCCANLICLVIVLACLIGTIDIYARPISMLKTGEDFCGSNVSIIANRSSRYVVASYITLLAIGIITFYVKIIREIHKIVPVQQNVEGQNVGQRRRPSNWKSIRTVLMVAGTMVLFLTPIYIIHAMQHVLGSNYHFYKHISKTWSLLNDICDPLIYSLIVQ